MNRRSFFRTLATAAGGFTVLPPATTYERVWQATRAVPSMGIKFWVAEEYIGKWKWVAYGDNGTDDLVRLEHKFNLLIADLPVPQTPFNADYTLQT